MIERAERQDIEKLVATLVEQAIAKTLIEQPSPGESDIAALNQQKRLELLDRVIRLEEGQKQLQEGQKALIQEMNRRFTEVQEGQKALIQEMNRRFAEMREDSDKRFREVREDSDKRFREMREDTGRRFQFVQWLIVAVGSFLTLVMTLLRFF